MCNLRHTVNFSFSGQCSSLSYFRKKTGKTKKQKIKKKNEKETLRQIHGSVKFTCGVGNKTLISLNGIPTKSHQNGFDRKSLGRNPRCARCHVSHLNSISISYLHWISISICLKRIELAQAGFAWDFQLWQSLALNLYVHFWSGCGWVEHIDRNQKKTRERRVSEGEPACAYIPPKSGGSQFVFRSPGFSSYDPLRGCFEQDRFTWKVLLQLFPGFQRVLQAIQWHHNKTTKKLQNTSHSLAPLSQMLFACCVYNQGFRPAPVQQSHL